MGRAMFTPRVLGPDPDSLRKLESETDSAHLSWKPIDYFGKKAGKLLVAAELIEVNILKF